MFKKRYSNSSQKKKSKREEKEVEMENIKPERKSKSPTNVG
jgi:hypothetical protein